MRPVANSETTSSTMKFNAAREQERGQQSSKLMAESCLSPLHEHHFAGGMETQLFIDGPAGVGAMQRNHANAALACFGEAALDERMGEAALAKLRLDEDVEQIAALIVSGMERVGRPVNDKKPCRTGSAPAVFDDPTEIPAISDPFLDPRLKSAAHGAEEIVLRIGHGGEHGAAVRGDERGVGLRGGACGRHEIQYRLRNSAFR